MANDLQNLPGTGLNGDHRVYSNFFSDNYIIQQVCIVQPKNLLIDVLRRRFKQDNIYTYRTDEFGFPLTPDMTGGDIDSEDTTKIVISDVYRYDVKFYPAITVKTGGGSYKALSMNQNATFKYRKDVVENDYGKLVEIKTPTHRVYAGLWDMSFDVTIYSESHTELEELTEIVSTELQYVSWNDLRANGLFIQGTSISAENAEPYANDYVYSHTVTLKTLTEWRAEIPLDNVIEKIVFYFDSTRTPIPPNATAEDAQQLMFDDVLEIVSIEI
jgi:hypothetical protein